MQLPKSSFPKPGSIATVSRKLSSSVRLFFSAWECRVFCSAAGLICRRRTKLNSLFPLPALSFSFLAAMIFVVFIPGYWTDSRAVQRLIIAAIYATGLITVTAVRARHRFDYLDEGYSLVEALLWLGIYLAINLQLSSLSPSPPWWDDPRILSEFGRPFYWTTWVLIWCLPPIVLARGIHQKDRFVIAVGAIVAILTFISNKPYLG